MLLAANVDAASASSSNSGSLNNSSLLWDGEYLSGCLLVLYFEEIFSAISAPLAAKSSFKNWK
jgi:hypothetical protein